jgi:hypothetical protein
MFVGLKMLIMSSFRNRRQYQHLKQKTVSISKDADTVLFQKQIESSNKLIQEDTYIHMHVYTYVRHTCCVLTNPPIRMYVCMYVFVYVCTYVCMYVYVCMFVHMYVCMYVCVCVCACVCIQMHTYIHTCSMSRAAASHRWAVTLVSLFTRANGFSCFYCNFFNTSTSTLNDQCSKGVQANSLISESLKYKYGREQPAFQNILCRV